MSTIQKFMPVLTYLLQNAQDSEAVAGKYDGWFSGDLTDYAIFEIELSVINALVGDDINYGASRVKRYGELSGLGGWVDYYDVVPWPYKRMAVCYETKTERSEYSTVYVPYKRKGNFWIACAMHRKSDGKMQVFEVDHGYSLDFDTVPVLFDNGRLRRPEDFDSAEHNHLVGPICTVMALLEELENRGSFNAGFIKHNPKNAKRIARGKKPLFDWHTVNVKPKPLSYYKGEPGELTGIKRRQHDVRGHYRHYKSGKTVFVKSHKKGDPSLGVVFKDYRVSTQQLDKLPPMK